MSTSQKTTHTPGPSGHDNARLIAAAPDLLAALKTTISEIDWHVENAGLVLRGMGAHNVDVARAAIAKAKGTG